MSNSSVFIFLMLRALYGSISDKNLVLEGAQALEVSPGLMCSYLKTPKRSEKANEMQLDKWLNINNRVHSGRV